MNIKQSAGGLSVVEKSFPEFVAKDDALVIKSLRKDVREVDFIASSERVDAHGDVIDQASWNLLDYTANPIVLYGHNSRELPIGKSVFTAIKDGMLHCTLKITDKIQLAREVWDLICEDILRAVSVGFKPVNGGYEMRGGEDVWVWRNSILKEISVVPIGANPDALAKQLDAVNTLKGLWREQANKTPSAGVPAQLQPKEAGTTGNAKGQDDMKTAEQLQKELDAKTAEHNDLAQKHSAANVKLVEAEQRAEKAEAAKTVADKALEKATGEIDSLKTAAKALETEHSKACTDRDNATKRADDLDAQLVEIEVETQVGKKITPAEKPEWVELRKKDKALYQKLIDKRPDNVCPPEGKVTAPEVPATKNAGDHAPPTTAKSSDVVKAGIEAMNALGDIAKS